MSTERVIIGIELVVSLAPFPSSDRPAHAHGRQHLRSNAVPVCVALDNLQGRPLLGQPLDGRRVEVLVDEVQLEQLGAEGLVLVERVETLGCDPPPAPFVARDADRTHTGAAFQQRGEALVRDGGARLQHRVLEARAGLRELGEGVVVQVRAVAVIAVAAFDTEQLAAEGAWGAGESHEVFAVATS